MKVNLERSGGFAGMVTSAKVENKPFLLMRRMKLKT
jgi:hypothetical protein